MIKAPGANVAYRDSGSSVKLLAASHSTVESPEQTYAYIYINDYK